MTRLVRPFVHWNASVYRAMLVLYPFELRYRFGDEMVAVFAEDLAEACENRRMEDVVGIWWRAASEVLCIALPGRIANQALVAPAVSVVLHLAALGSVLALASFAESIPHGVLHGLITLRIDG